ncbi:unnamed protein product [Cercopithifilaria johnstoni]|uniref:Uncharacterized protein n=1 Tax=Cercopithifilaria johnstoni TaxID=2874296 RepID=A0A8J2MIM2_9BILA|nr:unnamed protein product [Cercopithifilaria johnstoni]
MGEMDDVTQAKGTTDDDQMKEFVNSGRNGRRNAVPEVDAQGVDPDAAKLAQRLSSMNTAGQDNYSINNSTGNNIIDSSLKLKADFRCFVTRCLLGKIFLTLVLEWKCSCGLFIEQLELYHRSC